MLPDLQRRGLVMLDVAGDKDCFECCCGRPHDARGWNESSVLTEQSSPLNKKGITNSSPEQAIYKGTRLGPILLSAGRTSSEGRCAALKHFFIHNSANDIRRPHSSRFVLSCHPASDALAS